MKDTLTTRLMVLGGLIPILGIGALLITSSRGPRRASTSVVATTQGTEMEIAALKAEVRALAQHQASTPVVTPEQPATPPAEQRPEPDRIPARFRDPEAAEKKADEVAVAQLELLDQTFAAEAREPGWAIDASKKLTAVLPKGNARFGTVECASTMCRINVAADQQHDVQIAVQKLTISLPWHAGAFAHSGGKGEAKVYVMREGEELPMTEGMQSAEL